MTVVPTDNFADAPAAAKNEDITVDLTGMTVEPTEFDSLSGGDGSGLRNAYPFTSWAKYVPTTTETIQLVGTSPNVQSPSNTLVVVVYTAPSSGAPGPGNVVLLDELMPDYYSGNLLSFLASDTGYTVNAGQTLWFQFFAPSPSPVDSHGIPISGTLHVQNFVHVGQPVDLEVSIAEPSAQATASLGFTYDMAVSVQGGASAIETIAINSSYATVDTAATVRAGLHLQGNQHVLDYTDEISAPPGGSVTPASTAVPNFPRDTEHADVFVHEATGNTGTTVTVDDQLSLLATDTPSVNSDDFAASPLSVSQVRSVERWINLTFEGGYNAIRNLRVWSADAIPTGWRIRYGITDSYTTPTVAPSTVATTDLPTSDPGFTAPGLLSGNLAVGPDDRTSRWLVLQATADPSTVAPGPIGGYIAESNDPGALQLRFAWTES